MLKRHHLFIYSALFFTLSLTACAGEPLRKWPEQVGKVLEEGTNKPIAGAIIVARWKGQTSSIADTRSICYHVETTTTDEQGIYRTTPWDEGFRHGVIHGKVVSIKVYKAGYDESDLTYTKIRSYRQNIYYLKPFKGTREERLKYLLEFPLGCGHDDGLGKVRSKILMLQYSEAKKSMETGGKPTSVEKIIFNSFKWRIAREFVDPHFKLNPTVRDTRAKKYIMEHMQ